MFTTQRRIEFGDTDMAGIAHFSNFFRFMEAAETSFFIPSDSRCTWNEQGVRLGFPRVSVSCDFSKPAIFEDVLDIAVTVEKIGRKSVTYRFDFTRSGEAIAVGRITAVLCRTVPGHVESIEIPETIRKKLQG